MIAMYDKLPLLSHCVLEIKRHQSIAVFENNIINGEQFYRDVKALASTFSAHRSKHFALYYEQAYPFCVALFSLLHSNKQVYIASNNKKNTATRLLEQECVLLGEWLGEESIIIANQASNYQFTSLDVNASQISIFTSGSSGQPKLIRKTLQQFQSEIEVLEHYWGQDLAEAQVLATVSHQHIYGLLFRVLWPLAAGRCFHSEMYLSPETLLKHVNSATYWVASPAQLKRLDKLTCWEDIDKLSTIFSSGAALSKQTAVQIQQNTRLKVLEIYGSSETGGIAWRQSVDNELWETFEGVTLSSNEQGQTCLLSPYLLEAQKPYCLDDKIQMSDENHFSLLGRVDRIVKIEEKRLSLDELERVLEDSEWVSQCYTLIVKSKRDKIAAILVLSAIGNEFLRQQGRNEFIKQLRRYLMDSFETVVLPKKWLFMQSLPITTQAKINQELLNQLLSLDSQRFPQILNCHLQYESAELQCCVLPKIIYFDGHFPEQLILPGVTQLAWAEKYGKIFFNINKPFLRMEVIKFKKIICPTDIITITLSWKAETGKLYFELRSGHDSHSSGRIVYGDQV